MTETNSFINDLKSATGSPTRSTQGRLVALVLALVAAVLVVAWITSRMGGRIGKLEQAFTTMESERFVLGLHFREEVVRLNSTLLRYQLSGESADREKFSRIAREFIGQLNASKTHSLSADEHELVRQIEEAFGRHQDETEELLDRSLRGVRRDSVLELQEQIEGKSEQLLHLIDQLVSAQQSALGSFFTGTKATLVSLQSLLWVSVGLLFLLVALVAALMFRVWIAPLRVQLSESQAAVDRQEKLAALGTLAAGVAHEIRNPLTAIKFRLFSLKKALPGDFGDNEDVTIINGELNRLERIVKDFLQFARPSEPEIAVVPVADLLHATQLLLTEELAKQGIQLQLDPCPAALIRADPQQIRQVLINLIHNAAESIHGSGTITLRAREGAARLSHRPQPVVILDVADSGHGIPAGAEKRIFDPFFSTKESGSGLGLPIAARIVEKHGGSIHYVTQPERGTTFSIVLPTIGPDESKNTPD